MATRVEAEGYLSKAREMSPGEKFELRERYGSWVVVEIRICPQCGHELETTGDTVRHFRCQIAYEAEVAAQIKARAVVQAREIREIAARDEWEERR